MKAPLSNILMRLIVETALSHDRQLDLLHKSVRRHHKLPWSIMKGIDKFEKGEKVVIWLRPG
jgi:hypothetical protein